MLKTPSDIRRPFNYELKFGSGPLLPHATHSVDIQRSTNIGLFTICPKCPFSSPVAAATVPITYSCY